MWSNIKDNLFEYIIGVIAFITLGTQFIMFLYQYKGDSWLSNFGDYFGFSAAFLSALVIVLLIRELREQRESRVKLEKSFDDNAKTLNSVKEFFESQAEYQNEQVVFINQQKNQISIESLRNKYDSRLNNIMYFKSEYLKRLERKNGDFNHLVNNLLTQVNKSNDISSDSIYEVFNDEMYKLEPFMMCILRTLDSIKKDIELLVEENFDVLLSSEIDIMLKDKSMKNELLVLLDYLVNINSILDIEDKYTFLIYNTYFNRTNKSDYTMLDTLLFDDFRILWDNKISFKNLSNSSFKLKARANNIIDTLEQIKIVLD